MNINFTSIGFCVPAVCEPNLIYNIFNSFLAKHNLTIKGDELINCYTNEVRHFSLIDILAM